MWPARWAVALAFASILAGPTLAADGPAGAVRLESPVRLVAGADGIAAGPARVCNDGASVARVTPELSDLSALDADGRPYRLDTARRVSVETGNRPIAEAGEDIAAGRCLSLRLEFSGVRQAGVSTATLRDGARELAAVQVVRTHAPFRIRVDGPSADRIDARAVGGGSLRIRLLNEDDMTYRVRWRLELPDRPAGGIAHLNPNRGVALEVPALASSPVGLLESGLLRTAVREGRLVVEHEPDGGLAPYPLARREFPVRVTFSAFGPTGQLIANTALILVLLLVGIGISLLVNYAMPMQRRRVAAKERLARLEGNMVGLGRHVPRRILNRLRLEKRRLRQDLGRLWPVDPTTEAALEKFDRQITSLERRILLVTTAGEHLVGLGAGQPLAVIPQDEVRQMCSAVFGIVDKPEVGDEDLKRAQASLATAATLRAGAGLAPSEPMVEVLRKRAASVGATAALAGDDFDTLATMLWKELADVPGPSAADANGFVELSMAVAKAEVVVSMRRLLADGLREDLRVMRKAQAARVLDALWPGPDESLVAARRLVDEAEQGIGEPELVAALRAAKVDEGDVWIEADPPMPLTYLPVELRIRMRHPGFDAALARAQVDCEWTVGGETLPDEDWTAYAFFEKPSDKGHGERFPVEATLKPRGAEAVPVKLGQGLAVPPEKSYAWSSVFLSLGSLLVTMLIVGIGLIAGAQEKIQSLDWLTGVVTVIGLGFGADVLKRVLTRS